MELTEAEMQVVRLVQEALSGLQPPDLYDISAEELADFAFSPKSETFWLEQAGVSWGLKDYPGTSPLDLLIIDAGGGEILHKLDPIAEAIELNEDSETLEWLHQAIASLQSGIDRLRAHEAQWKPRG